MASAKSVDPSLETEIVSLLEQGRKIEAVKVYREEKGVGLKEAKVAVGTSPHVVNHELIRQLGLGDVPGPGADLVA